MSKWTDFRDEVVKATQLESIAEQTKNNVLTAIVSEGIPFVEATAQAFTHKLQEQAKEEKGWCMIRDKFIIPLAFSVGLFAMKNVVETTVKNIK